MSQNNKVIWSEGMFLRPQHFQQAGRYIENYIQQRCESVRPCTWGFNKLQLDQKLLGLGKIGFVEASGVFPDGTPFNIPHEDAAPLPIDVPEAIHEEEVFLALPLRRPGTSDIDAKNDPDSLARLQAYELEVNDSSTLGGGSAAIQTGKLRMRIMLQNQHRDEYACLGVGSITELRQDKLVVLDSEYLAPTQNCQALSGFAGFLKELHGLLHHRAEALAARISLSDRGGAAEIADFLLLQAVNRYLPLITHLTALQGLHPEALYQNLISIAGDIATFTSNDRRAPEFPQYAHDDLQATFLPVFSALRQSLSMVLEQNAISIPLQERKYGIRVATLNDRSLLDHAQFVLAVSASLPTEDLRKRFPAQVKIGSVENIRQLVNMQLPGIRVRPLPVAPRQIPYHTGFVYFELQSSGEYWEQLKASGGFAMHVGGEFPGLKMEFWAIKG